MSRLYGRRRGRRLRTRQQHLLEEALPRLAISLPPRVDSPLDLDSLFGRPVATAALEIGFGAGEHLAWQAAHARETAFIGVEPFIPGLAALLRRIEEDKLDNIRVFTDDAHTLLARLPEGRFARIYVLFPDPWPKTRHHKRRLVTADSLLRFAQLLTDGGELRLASDDQGYVRWMLEAGRRVPVLAWQAWRPRDWRERPLDWPETRYEAKARRIGRTPVFLRFRRAPRAAPPSRKRLEDCRRETRFRAM